MEVWKSGMAGRRDTALMEEVASELREEEVKECKDGGRVKNE